jgi:hypothetical protein
MEGGKMATKDALQRVSCDGKVSYQDHTQAMHAVEYLRKEKGLRGLGCYKCQFCKEWHVGRQDRKLIRSAIGYAKSGYLKRRFKKILKQKEI